MTALMPLDCPCAKLQMSTVVREIDKNILAKL
jgi:hypothetical protein